MDLEKTLSPQESLDLITEAILKSKDNIRDNSYVFLLWGWLVTIASFAFFLLKQYTHFRYYFIPFPILSTFGLASTALWFNKKYSGGTLSYSTYFIYKMWTVLAVSFILVVLINVLQDRVPFTYTLLIAGIGTLISGWTLRFQPLVVGGIIFLLSTILSIYLPDGYKPLLQGCAVITGYLIPGYLLKNSKV